MTVDKTLMPGGGSHRGAFLRNPPSHVEAMVLAPNVAESVTVPFGATTVLFSGAGDFFARPNGAAAVPAADVTDGSAAELNPALWQLDGVSSLSLVSSAAATVTMTFYTGPGANSGMLFPLTLPSLVEWFDSQEGSTVLGANPTTEVETWVGQKGAISLSAGLGSGPAYLERAGKRVLYFGNLPRLDVALPSFGASGWAENAHEIWAVFEVSSGGGRVLYQFSNSADADSDVSFNYAGNGGSTAAWRNDAGTLARRDPVLTSLYPAKPVIFRQWRGQDGLVNAKVFPDRITSEAAGPADPTTVDRVTIGSLFSSGSPVIGYYSAFLIFNDALSDEDAASLAAFLRARYGTA